MAAPVVTGLTASPATVQSRLRALPVRQMWMSVPHRTLVLMEPHVRIFMVAIDVNVSQVRQSYLPLLRLHFPS